jgi:hypothetical protein
MLRILDIPVHVCDKVYPKNKPYLLPNWIKVCPFCGQILGENKMTDEAKPEEVEDDEVEHEEDEESSDDAEEVDEDEEDEDENK